jgi:catechol 2,3-dioxygenase-like lactoylglutathione lyase family enzyme
LTACRQSFKLLNERRACRGVFISISRTAHIELLAALSFKECRMLASSKLQTIVWTSRLLEAEEFYSHRLGLTLKGRSDGALVYDVNGGDLRVSPIPRTEPTAHTVLGFAVPDLNATIDTLSERGLKWERFPGMPHDATGVLRTPDGAKVVWFRDPDGNLLSIVEYA